MLYYYLDITCTVLSNMVSLFVWSEFVEIFRLDIKFTVIIVMPAKRACEAACERSFEVHVAFFCSTLVIVTS